MGRKKKEKCRMLVYDDDSAKLKTKIFWLKIIKKIIKIKNYLKAFLFAILDGITIVILPYFVTKTGAIKNNSEHEKTTKNPQKII